MISNQSSLNDLFDYGLKIFQNDDYFKFSIDSILLAEFVELKKDDKKVLDLCSGNLPVPLILGTKSNKLNFTAIEYQKEIYDLGNKTLEYNNINNIEYINDDVKNINNHIKLHDFDIVTCNPPYFKVYSDTNINDNSVKAIARHEILIDLDGICDVASKSLKNGGYFYMVHRPERLADIILSLNKYHFGIKEISFIYNNSESDCLLILISAIYNGKDYVKIHKNVFLDGKTSYKGIFGR